MPRRAVSFRATLSALGTLLAGVFSFVPFVPRLLRALVTGPGDRLRTLELIRSGLDTGVREAPGAPPRSARVLLVAGEPSGDLHGADLARALRALCPEIRLEGLGGPRMAAAGVELHADLVSDPVMGVWPVLRRLPFFFSLYRSLLVRLETEPPDVVVGIDYPGLNLRLGRAARARGVPFVDYIAPQVWAWAPWRARALARGADHVVAILPFEEPLFRSAGAAVSYVGHPLFEHLRDRPADEEYRAELRAGSPATLVALLPGSRRAEVRANLPLQLDVAGRVAAEHAGARFVLPLAAERLRPVVEAAIADAAATGGQLDVRVVAPGRGDDAMAAADCALTVSGTATLHLVAHGVPAVVMYRVSAAGRLFSRALLVAPFIALPNLLAGSAVLPEFLARPADAQRITAALFSLMPGGAAREEALAALAAIRERLAIDDVPERAARWVLATAADARSSHR